MDHSVAAIRRYPEIELARGPTGVHAGMTVHPSRGELFFSVPGDNKIMVVKTTGGQFARTAREEYPIFPTDCHHSSTISLNVLSIANLPQGFKHQVELH